MADITMCSNPKCVSAEFCERKTMQISTRQSFAYYALKDNEMKCEMFFPNEKGRVFEILANSSTRWPWKTTV